MEIEHLKQNWNVLQTELAELLEKLNRSRLSCKVIAVTKNVDVITIRNIIQIGAEHIGENRVQEAKSKFEVLKNLPCNWHFIGTLQTNKVKYALKMFQFVHSVDRKELIDTLGKLTNENHIPINIFLQVNVSGKQTQSGCNPENLDSLIEFVLQYPYLHLVGLMCIASPVEEVGEKTVRKQFSLLANYFTSIQSRYKLNGFSELSMGMSGDWKLAVLEGATFIRIGTAIFGERQLKG
ncbi:MAG: YggS family pyridoxal phosphate-dependent enzyme [bacterium]|nr:YggS family pyridoxal phosphate-dependent enzyme [bacterium]